MPGHVTIKTRETLKTRESLEMPGHEALKTRESLEMPGPKDSIRTLELPRHTLNSRIIESDNRITI